MATFDKIKKELYAREDFKALIRMQNIMSLKRIEFPDHGIGHVKIVSSYALKIFSLLREAGIKTTTQKDHRFSDEDVKVILLLASSLHDVGMSVDRDMHEWLSVVMAKDIIREVLMNYYSPYKATLMLSEVLHAILSHRRRGKPKTLEAEIVRLADGLDIAKGRAYMVLDKSREDLRMNIHWISSLSIYSVKVRKGRKKPVDIEVVMKNPAGIFLVSEFLREKLKGGRLEKHVRILAKFKGQKKTYEVI